MQDVKPAKQNKASALVSCSVFLFFFLFLFSFLPSLFYCSSFNWREENWLLKFPSKGKKISVQILNGWKGRRAGQMVKYECPGSLSLSPCNYFSSKFGTSVDSSGLLKPQKKRSRKIVYKGSTVSFFSPVFLFLI